MSPKIESCLILLTYKGKVLLLNQEDIPTDMVFEDWHFIEVHKLKNKSLEDTIVKEVARETGIQLSEINLVSGLSYNEQLKYFFHAKLTDDHVNHIERYDGQLIQFFTLKEISALSLSPLTKLLIVNHQDLLQKNNVTN